MTAEKRTGIAIWPGPSNPKQKGRPKSERPFVESAKIQRPVTMLRNRATTSIALGSLGATSEIFSRA